MLWMLFLLTAPLVEQAAAAGFGSYRDEFRVYGGNQGTRDWSGEWTEQNDDGDPLLGSGEIMVEQNAACAAGPCLSVSAGTVGAAIFRQADLGSASSATLTYDYDNALSTTAQIVVEVYNGVSWTTLKTYDSGNTGAGSESFDLTPYIAANTQIRFRATATAIGNPRLLIDNVQIAYGGDTVRDEFAVYGGNQGTQDWSTEWTEQNDDGNPVAGYIGVRNNPACAAMPCLSLEARSVGDAIFRVADLSGASSANLAYDYDSRLFSSDEIVVEVYDGSTWTTLKTYDSSNSGAGSESFDLTPYIAANTQIRFRVTGSQTSRTLRIDNVEIVLDGTVIDGDFSEWDDGVGNEFCLQDQCGADDWTNPARLDLTKMCIASNQFDTIYTMLAVDDVTLSGQIITSCMLLDTDDPDNGFADFVLCMTLEGSGPTTVQSVELFSCNDTAVDGCPGATLSKTYAPSEYGFSNTEIGPFGNVDSFVELEMPYIDLGITGGQVLFSSYISYPGQSFLTSPKDSIFCNGGQQDYDARIEYNLDSGSASTTPVTLSYFRAEGMGGRVAFSWQTVTETGNLGFHLYVFESGELRRLNAELIPSAVVDSLAPQEYAFEAFGVGGELFVLEDVDIFGASRFHGPFALDRAHGRRSAGAEPIAWGRIRQAHEVRKAERAGRRRGGLGREYGEARLLVERDGIYRVSYEALAAAGVDLAGVPSSHLSLSSAGAPVPMRVGGQGLFGPGSFVEFVGEALDTLYTRTNVYTLRVEQRASRRLVEDRTPVRPRAQVPESYLETKRVERNRAYHFAAPGEDPWHDTRLLAIGGPVEASFDLELEGRVEGGGPVLLSVALWGVTDFPQAPDHHLVVEVNGVEMADEWFDGLKDHPVEVEVPEWVLQPAGNRLRLLLPHDTGVKYDLVHYDHYRVSYPRRFVARDGGLQFTAAAEAFQVEGLPSSDVEVYRVTGERVERLSRVVVAGVPGSYTATFAGSDGEASYYVSTSAALEVPGIEVAPPRRELVRGEAELLVIAHPDFLEAVAPLAAARRGSGFSVQVVDVEEVYTNFSHGVFDPQAIREFIRRAYLEMGTDYVLLVGGDTYDYHDYLGQGAISFMPTLYARTDRIVHFAPVDPLYTDVDEDGVPDLAIGRLPVRTVAELEAVVTKTLEYDGIGYRGSAVLAADAYDMAYGYSFAADSEAMLTMLPSDWQVERAYVDDLGLAGARQLLIDSINDGVALASYFGHSGPTVWSFQGLFSSADADALENWGRPTVVTQWGCWNTYHVSPSYDTLGHRLLLNADRGAAAVLGAATLTEAAAERQLGRRLFQRLAAPGQTLGRAVMEAKRDLATSERARLDVLLGWTLLGDPTLSVQP